MTTYKFVHVEDSPEDAELIRVALRDAPFAPHHDPCRPGSRLCRRLDAATPDAILCDYDMPAFSAERALQMLQERGLDCPSSSCPRTFGESAAVVAMQNGASDYISKRDLRRLSKAVESAIDRCRSRHDKARAQVAPRRERGDEAQHPRLAGLADRECSMRRGSSWP
jgi:DNA-binding NtrC family response regulator